MCKSKNPYISKFIDSLYRNATYENGSIWNIIMVKLKGDFHNMNSTQLISSHLTLFLMLSTVFFFFFTSCSTSCVTFGANRLLTFETLLNSSIHGNMLTSKSVFFFFDKVLRHISYSIFWVCHKIVFSFQTLLTPMHNKIGEKSMLYVCKIFFFLL